MKKRGFFPARSLECAKITAKGYEKCKLQTQHIHLGSRIWLLQARYLRIEIICYDTKIYVPQSLHRRVIYWYHLYLNHPSGSRPAKKSGGYATGKAL